MTDFEYKQVILMRQDLSLPKGKMSVQAAHASIGAFKKARNSVVREWEIDGEKKVVLEVGSKTELLELNELAKRHRIPTYLVRDAGLTEVKPGTFTALGIGPEDEKVINRVTGDVKLL